MEFSYKIEEKQENAVVRMSGNLIEKSQAIELMERVDEITSRGSCFVLFLRTYVRSCSSQS
jgi:hypothetical protein